MVLETSTHTKTRSVGQSWEVMASCPCVSGLKPWSGFSCHGKQSVVKPGQEAEVATTKKPNGVLIVGGEQSICSTTEKASTSAPIANYKPMSEQKSEQKVAEEAPNFVETKEEYEGVPVIVTKSWHDGLGDFEGHQMVRFNVVFESVWYYSQYDGDMEQVLHKTNPVMPDTESEHYAHTEAEAYARGFINSFEHFRGEDNE